MPSLEELMTAEEEFEAGEAEHFPKGGDGKAAMAADPADGALPHLPDGIGLDYETVRAMLAAKHGTVYDLEDPVMMMVTLINANLSELEKLHQRHNEAVTRIMAEQSGKYIQGVKATTDALGKTLAENSVEAVREIFNSHAADLKANTINARWCAGVMAIAALVQVAMMAIRMWG